MPVLKTKFRVPLAVALVCLFPAAPSLADDAEKEKLKKCEMAICSIVVGKKAEGEDFTCELSKTWEKEDIAKEAEEKKLTWSLGSAKCDVSIKIARATLVSAVTQPAYDLAVPPQSVQCEIEQGDTKHPIKLTLAPKIKFKNGEAVEAALGLGAVEGPAVVKGLIEGAAAVENTFGVFQADIIKEINKFITKKCPKTVAEAK